MMAPAPSDADSPHLGDFILDPSRDDRSSDGDVSPSQRSEATASPSAAAAAAAEDEPVSKYMALYSLPCREKVVHVMPCTLQGRLFGATDKCGQPNSETLNPLCT
jgi:hypothetical protein